MNVKASASEGAIVIRRTFDASLERVFDAWLCGDLLARWFVCTPHWTARVTNDAVTGGAYRIEMHDGARLVGTASGRYVEIDRPHRLVFTWTSDGVVGVRESTVTIELRAVDAKGSPRTELTLLHDVARATDTGRAHEAGWVACLHSLDRELSVTDQQGGTNDVR